MTSEEAINMLHGIRADNLNLDDAYTKDKYEALGMAIKALEQEPCDDCVSRQAVLDKAYAYGNGLEPEGYCVNVEDIQALPPIQPKAKVGKWIVDQDAFSEINGYILKCHCSECNHKKEFYDHKSITTPTLKNASFIDNYCPNCGAKMEVEE